MVDKIYSQSSARPALDKGVPEDIKLLNITSPPSLNFNEVIISSSDNVGRISIGGVRTCFRHVNQYYHNWKIILENYDNK